MNEIFSFYTQRKFTIFYGYESELRDVQHTSEANKFTSLQLKIYDQTNLRMHEVCKYFAKCEVENGKIGDKITK